jgi:hypothetical protein
MKSSTIVYIVTSTIWVLCLVGFIHTIHSISDTNQSVRELRIVIADIDVAASRNTAQPSNNNDVPTLDDATVMDTVTSTEAITSEQELEPVVNPAALPKQVYLSVPFTSQAPEKNWDQPWQDACEEAAILMLDAYYKGYNISPLFARDELLKQVAWQESKGWGGSIDIIDVRTAAAWYLQVPESQLTIIRYPEVEEIKTQLANKRPVLAVADGTALPNPYFSGDGPVYHALLIIGYDDATSEFITNDPGTQFGKNFRYTYDDLMNALRDWNNGDVKHGVPVVLVKT